MSGSRQTILGAGGVIGRELARILPEYADRVRLVSRNPRAVTDGNETRSADLLERDDVIAAVEGSTVAYLVAGLPYKAKIWQEQWPRIMANVIEACRDHQCRPVFFDNMYMYDPARLDAMDENTPVAPTSRKGAVRARIATMLMEAVEQGRLDALIARSADFYGPGHQQTSVLTRTVFERLATGTAAQWLCSLRHRHSFTYTPDAARATALLGNTADACGRVWHLPTAPDPPTGRQWVEAIAEELGVEPRVQVAGRLLLTAMGLVVPEMRELKEMAYQYDRDYVFGGAV
ncbi:MAG: NAD-dependent epimerase/dehydratase family protein [Gammaproteobacteria bacterium]|nr:NAD-dependent epimerase/dehydratase family protein [Gammaproteobacteria bacterium]